MIRVVKVSVMTCYDIFNSKDLLGDIKNFFIRYCNILDALEETLISIFQENPLNEEARYVIRKNERTSIIVSEALRYETLSTKNSVLIVYLKPGEKSGKEGKMEITVGDKIFILEEGDSLSV